MWFFDPRLTSPRHRLVRGAPCQKGNMARYFIDIHDGTEVAYDEAGYEMPDLDAASAQAVRIMSSQARRSKGGSERQDYVATLRDVDGFVRLRFKVLIGAGPIG